MPQSQPPGMDIDPQNLMRVSFGVFNSTPEGRYVSVNCALAGFLGYESPEKLITSVTNIAAQIYVDPSERAEFMRDLNAKGEVVDYECRYRHRDGSIN